MARVAASRGFRIRWARVAAWRLAGMPTRNTAIASGRNHRHRVAIASAATASAGSSIAITSDTYRDWRAQPAPNADRFTAVIASSTSEPARSALGAANCAAGS